MILHLEHVILIWGLVGLTSSIYFPQSPCPQYFSYILREKGDPIASVRVPVNASELPVTLSVHLAIGVALKSRYVGVVVLSNNPTIVLGNLLSGNAKLVNYTVRFPLPNPAPVLKSLSVNNKTLCIGKGLQFHPVFGGVITDIFLQNTFPSRNFDLKKILQQFQGGNESLAQQEEFRCGQPDLLQPNKVDGILYQKYWPWLVAIFVTDIIDGDRFYCAGNLLSERHVVTAAHCIKNQLESYWDASDFIVYLGIHDLKKYKESHSQVKKVIKIEIHPEYNDTNYKADIAILIIEEAVLNEEVKPVCIWNGGLSLNPLIGHLGTVVGWGIDRRTNTLRSEPAVFHLPIVGQDECLRSRKEFLYITSERTLCAGLRNGTGPCNGDSGSGLLILSYNSMNSLAWHLRGLISLSLLDRTKGTCDLNEYTVFTDIARFSSWINEIVEQT